MIDVNARQSAIDWLNSKRDFFSGLNILTQSGFKPGVVRRLQMLGDTPEGRMHLIENVRQFISFCGGAAEVRDSDADLGVINGKQPEELKQRDAVGSKSIDQMAADIVSGKDKETKPNAAAAIVTYAMYYRQREEAHRSLGKVPQTNDEKNVYARKRLSDTINECTTKMEKIYPLVEGFLKEGKEPSKEALEVAEKTEEEVKDEGEKNGSGDELESLTTEELKKKIKSVKTKILRKNNLLLYQQETKAEVENPLPDCPKRVKYETEIEKLKAELENLEYALAKKG